MGTPRRLPGAGYLSSAGHGPKPIGRRVGWDPSLLIAGVGACHRHSTGGLQSEPKLGIGGEWSITVGLGIRRLSSSPAMPPIKVPIFPTPPKRGFEFSRRLPSRPQFFRLSIARIRISDASHQGPNFSDSPKRGFNLSDSPKRGFNLSDASHQGPNLSDSTKRGFNFSDSSKYGQLSVCHKSFSNEAQSRRRDARRRWREQQCPLNRLVVQVRPGVFDFQ